MTRTHITVCVTRLTFKNNPWLPPVQFEARSGRHRAVDVRLRDAVNRVVLLAQSDDPCGSSGLPVRLVRYR